MSRARFTAPNLYVIGAAKAASSSLQRWLGDHPDVGVSRIPETRFLMDAEDPLAQPGGYAETGLEGYGAFFPEELRPEGCRYVLDVTPMYYYQQAAQEVIAALPERHVIFIARRPSRRILSLYNYAQNNIGVLNREISFAGFVEEVRKGVKSEVVGHRPMMAHAMLHSQYARYIALWQRLVGPANVTVMIFEEIVADQTGAMKALAERLGLAPGFYDDYGFPKENESFAVRNHLLHKLMRGTKDAFPAPLRKLLKSAYMTLNTEKSTAPLSTDDLQALEMLDREFAEWDAQLGALIGRDGPIWPLETTLARQGGGTV